MWRDQTCGSTQSCASTDGPMPVEQWCDQVQIGLDVQQASAHWSVADQQSMIQSSTGYHLLCTTAEAVQDQACQQESLVLHHRLLCKKASSSESVWMHACRIESYYLICLCVCVCGSEPSECMHAEPNCFASQACMSKTMNP